MAQLPAVEAAASGRSRPAPAGPALRCRRTAIS